jgi:hypothetical protein
VNAPLLRVGQAHPDRDIERENARSARVRPGSSGGALSPGSRGSPEHPGRFHLSDLPGGDLAQRGKIGWLGQPAAVYDALPARACRHPVQLVRDSGVPLHRVRSALPLERRRVSQGIGYRDVLVTECPSPCRRWVKPFRCCCESLLGWRHCPVPRWSLGVAARDEPHEVAPDDVLDPGQGVLVGGCRGQGDGGGLAHQESSGLSQVKDGAVLGLLGEQVSAQVAEELLEIARGAIGRDACV